MHTLQVKMFVLHLGICLGVQGESAAQGYELSAIQNWGRGICGKSLHQQQEVRNKAGVPIVLPPQPWVLRLLRAKETVLEFAAI